jgi:hypothetical protein
MKELSKTYGKEKLPASFKEMDMKLEYQVILQLKKDRLGE